MFRKPGFFLLAASLLLTGSVARADRLGDLEKKIAELENRQAETMVRTEGADPAVRSFLDDQVTFGGFFEPAFQTIFGKDTETQAANTSNLLGINLAASFTPRLRFVSQFVTALTFPLGNPNNDPQGAALALPARREFGAPFFGAVLPQGYLEFRSSEGFGIQGGLGYVPFGIAFQQREPVLFIRRGGPQILRTTNLVSPLWGGVHVLGSFPLEDSAWGYDGYTFTPINNTKVPGVGGRLWWSPSSEFLKFGLSSQIGKRGGDTYKAIGTDLQLRLSSFSVVAELARNLTQGGDPWSVYIEPNLAILEQRVTVYTFADYADSTLNQTGTGRTALPDPYQKWEYGAGINWLPVAQTRLRLGVTLNNYVGGTAVTGGQDRDYISIDTSAGVAF